MEQLIQGQIQGIGETAIRRSVVGTLRYGQPQEWLQGRRFQVGLKLQF